MFELIVVSLIWSFSFGLVKHFLSSLDSNFIAFVRMMLALLVFLPFHFPDYADYISVYFKRWEEMIGGRIEETVELLSRLREAGYPLYALSNWSAETFHLVQDQ